MSNKIYANYDFLDKIWKVTTGVLHPGSAVVIINVSAQDITEKSLSYGLDFYVDSNLINSEKFPKFRILHADVYNYTTESPICLLKDNTHKLRLWIENYDERIEHEMVLDNILDPQPYPSWILSDGIWIPPVPKPQEKAIWNWNEKSQKWDNLDYQYMPGSAGTATEN